MKNGAPGERALAGKRKANLHEEKGLDRPPV